MSYNNNISIKNYAELAHNILNSETQYKSNKAIISELFKEKETEDFESIVKNRITIIDSYYSTQMSKRLYGIKQMAEAIAKYSDKELINATGIFLNNPSKKGVIKSLFAKQYGIDKSGNPFGKAISLISKYLYFLNNCNFPIYDSLALISYKLLKRNIFKTDIKTISEHNYFECVKHLNTLSTINNYEKLDNLLWLIGKLSKGSFTILMDINKYLELINTDEISSQFKELPKKGNKSTVKDEIIRNYIKNNYPSSNLFTKNQKTFFEFVFSLK